MAFIILMSALERHAQETLKDQKSSLTEIMNNLAAPRTLVTLYPINWSSK
jgi:hypothetical protein